MHRQAFDTTFVEKRFSMNEKCFHCSANQTAQPAAMLAVFMGVSRTFFRGRQLFPYPEISSEWSIRGTNSAFQVTEWPEIV